MLRARKSRGLSTVAGFMPLVVASGAGAASQQAIGLAVVGGMVAATVMSLTFTPAFYVVMKRLGEKDAAPVGESAAES